MRATLIRALQRDCRINWSMETNTHTESYQVWEVYVQPVLFLLQLVSHCHSAEATSSLPL